MKLLYNGIKNKGEMLKKYIAENISGDYIYDYPPRQAYAEMNTGKVLEKVINSLSIDKELNLYIHFPFCKQICSYCNLFAICDTDDQTFHKYFDALKKEILFYKPYIAGKTINTIYLGGGTPSWIDADLFKDFFGFLEKELFFSINNVSEVAIELSPDTAEREHLKQYLAAGINRVNIGVQAVASNELQNIGRKYDDVLIKKSIETVLSIGFNNVCIDLIYGLQGQTMESWMDSIKYVADCQPPTICPYPLTLRENTGFAYKGYNHIDGAEQYLKYEFARDYLLSRGYEQETHVRYKLKGSHGGYIQKENHWKQQNILGLGAGARSYLKLINYRNGYSVINRRKAFDKYLENIGRCSFAITDGYEMDTCEIMRKWLILGLNGLNLADFYMKYKKTPYEIFSDEFKMMRELNLIDERNGCIFYTSDGLKYRDLIVQMFFSDKVNDIISKFDYAQ